MNPNLCFEYQQLMLRHHQKNKAVLAEEMSSIKHRKQQNKHQEHKQDENKEKSLRSMVFENDNIVKVEEEQKNMNNKNANKIENNNNNNKQLFKILKSVVKHKKLVPVVANEPVVVAKEPVVVAKEPAVPLAKKNTNISKICKMFSTKSK